VSILFFKFRYIFLTAEDGYAATEVVTADRPARSAFVPQSRDYGVIDFTDNADGFGGFPPSLTFRGPTKR